MKYRYYMDIYYSALILIDCLTVINSIFPLSVQLEKAYLMTQGEILDMTLLNQDLNLSS